MFILGILSINTAYAQKGKITGQVVDAKTGEPLPGVNVIVEGTTIGAATDIDGYYLLLNVNAGIYNVKFSYVGYAPYIVRNVSVSVGLTTEINARISEEIYQGEEIVVQAERPVVQVDVSSNQVNFSKEEIKNLPIASVTAVVGLQAGVEGLSVRGGGSDELAFNVNGLTLRDERTNQPLTNISFTSISNVQVQTGGFNAEYGNIRSGLINVTTKEGDKEKYEVDALIRYQPAQPKNIGGYPSDPNSFFIRPYVDPDVAWTGTNNGAWDKYTQAQYQSFVGWYRISEDLLADNDPSNDLTPEAAQQFFLFQHRKSFQIQKPDYDIDINFGGPVPGISKMLGNLRFNMSMRKTQTMYLIPLATDRYSSDSYMLKLTSDIAKGVKLSIEGMLGFDDGTVYWAGYTNGYVLKYARPDEFSPYQATPDTVLRGIRAESFAIHPTTGRLWLSAGSPNDLPGISPTTGYAYNINTWYAFNFADLGTSAEIPVDSLAWTVAEGDTDVDGRARAMAWDAAGTTVYISQFNQNAPSVQKLTGTPQPVSNERISSLPNGYELKSNYPNPFNPTTNIEFTLANSGHVQLNVYDMLGRQVATVINRNMNSGSHTVTFDASKLSSGTYLYVLRVNGISLTNKMTLIK